MKDFFAENFGNFWKKVVLRKISGTFVFEKITPIAGSISARGPIVAFFATVKAHTDRTRFGNGTRIFSFQ
jgi:hypothetical protein